MTLDTTAVLTPSHHGQGQENQPWPRQIKVFPAPQRRPSVSISRPGPSELRRRPGPSELHRRGLGREPPARSFLACPKPTLYDDPAIKSRPRYGALRSGQRYGTHDPGRRVSGAAATLGGGLDPPSFHGPVIRVRRRFPGLSFYFIRRRPISGPISVWVNAGPYFVNITNT